MSTAVTAVPDHWLTEGVLLRRCVAWLLDAVMIAVLVFAAWMVLFTFGIVTLGIGMPALGLLPAVPFGYNWLTLAAFGATPGQAIMGLAVRRDDDLGSPTLLQSLISTIIYYLTLATSGLLLLVALITRRHRTLHDLLSGLVVVRSRALTPAPASWTMPPRA